MVVTFQLSDWLRWPKQTVLIVVTCVSFQAKLISYYNVLFIYTYLVLDGLNDEEREQKKKEKSERKEKKRQAKDAKRKARKERERKRVSRTLINNNTRKTEIYVITDEPFDIICQAIRKLNIFLFTTKLVRNSYF